MNEITRFPKAGDSAKEPQTGSLADITIAVAAEEPSKGGSYTRDAVTGLLTKNEPVDQVQHQEK